MDTYIYNFIFKIILITADYLNFSTNLNYYEKDNFIIVKY